MKHVCFDYSCLWLIGQIQSCLARKPYENLGMLYDIERTLYLGDVFENKFYDQRSSPFKKKFYDKRSSPLLKNYDTLKLVLTNFVCIGYQA